MDTNKSNSINIHMLDGSVIKFKTTDNHCLYHHVLQSDQSIDNIWNLFADTPEELLPRNPNKCLNIDTVVGSSDKYTKRQINAARVARELDNIIMRPKN